MTLENLPAGAPVVGIPANMIMSSRRVKQELENMSSSRGGVQQAVKQLGMIGASQSIPEFYLTVKILLEYERGDQSPYFPWLDSMPRLFCNAVSMTDFCYECLPPLVFRLSRDERMKFDNIFQVLKKVDIISNESKLNKDLVQWAFNVVHTRSLPGTGKNDVKIVPMADYFNHGTDTEINFTFDAQGNCLGSTTRDVAAGSPVRMSYGNPTNPSFFFTKYGFLDQTSPASFCKIMDITKSAETENLGGGEGFSKMLFYKNGGVSQEVWDVVLYDKVLQNKPDARQQFYNAHVQGDAATKQAIHNAFIMETFSKVQNHVDQFLEKIDALNYKTLGKDLNQHPRLPLVTAHNDFVRTTFEAVKGQLDPMVANLARERQLV